MTQRATPRAGHAKPSKRRSTRSIRATRSIASSRRASRLLLALLLGGAICDASHRVSADDKPMPATSPAPAQVQAVETPPTPDEPESDESIPVAEDDLGAKPNPQPVLAPNDATKPSVEAKSTESNRGPLRRLRLDAFRPRDSREPSLSPPKSYAPALKARVIETTPLTEKWRTKYGAAPTPGSTSPDGPSPDRAPPAVEPTRDPVLSPARPAPPASSTDSASPSQATVPAVEVDLPLAPPFDPPLAKRPLSGANSLRAQRLDPTHAGEPRTPVGVELIDPAAASAAESTRSTEQAPSAEPAPAIKTTPASEPTPAPTPVRPAPPARDTAPTRPEFNQPTNPPKSRVAPDSNAGVVRDSGVVREDVFPSRYQNLTPGESTGEDVRRRLGEPLSERPDGGDTILAYRSGPFRQIDVHIRKKVVDRIRVELMRPTAPDSVARELQLDDFPEAWLENEQGDLIGIAIPERGVIFELQPDTEATLVTHVVLGRISAELFRVRAEWRADHPVERMLEDLAFARQLDPADLRIAVREAELRAGLGEYSTALARLDEALKVDPRNPAVRLARADVLARVERHAEALQIVQDVLKTPGTPELYELMAEHQIGNLAARGPTRAFDLALDHHRRATELAAPLVNDKRATVRRAAKRILLDSHLGAANDIARGDFSDKPRMILKWLVTGQSVLTAVKDEYPDDARPEWRWSANVMRIYACETGLPKPLDRVAEIRRYAKAMLVEARDPAYQRQLHWETAEMLFDAMQIANAQDQYDLAIECIREAVLQAEAGALGRDSTLERDFFLGRLYFHLGSLHALHHKDHSAAVEHYRKAATYFVRPLPDSAKIDMGRQGERLVSMGLSYWQIGDREQGIRWTRQGAILMQDAVRGDTLDPRALQVPYNNLARMYHDLGRTDEARVYTARASELSRPDAVIRR